jgi:hypothetical protein
MLEFLAMCAAVGAVTSAARLWVAILEYPSSSVIPLTSKGTPLFMTGRVRGAFKGPAYHTTRLPTVTSEESKELWEHNVRLLAGRGWSPERIARSMQCEEEDVVSLLTPATK